MKKTKIEKRVINIPKYQFDIIKDYCDFKILDMTRWVIENSLEKIKQKPEDRLSLYKCYDSMDLDLSIQSILDFYADEMCNHTQALTIKSTNDEIVKCLTKLFYGVMNIEFNLWNWNRIFCKYGNFYLKLNLTQENGIYMVEPISPHKIERIEDSNINGNIKFQTDSETLGSTQISHFRLLSDSNYFPYGKSVLENSRISWKILTESNLDLGDVNYFTNKIYSELDVPPCYKSFSENVNKNNDELENLKFSRKIDRFKKTIVSELNKIAQIHLYANGYRGDSIVDFELTI